MGNARRCRRFRFRGWSLTSKRYLKLLDNNRHVSRDFTKEGNRYTSIQNEGETLEYTVDLTRLGTVSSVTGISGTLASNQFTFTPRLKDYDLKATMSTGEVIAIPLRFREYNSENAKDYCD